MKTWSEEKFTRVGYQGKETSERNETVKELINEWSECIGQRTQIYF